MTAKSGFPWSWGGGGILEKIAVMEKSWNRKISQKVMELLVLMAMAAF